MECETCNGSGIQKVESDVVDCDYPLKEYYEMQPCPNCNSTCDACDGTGEISVGDRRFPCKVCWAVETCTNCGGVGEFAKESFGPNGEIFTEHYPCKTCNTTGIVTTQYLREKSED